MNKPTDTEMLDYLIGTRADVRLFVSGKWEVWPRGFDAGSRRLGAGVTAREAIADAMKLEIEQ